MPANGVQMLDDIQNVDLPSYLLMHGYDLSPPHSEKNEGYITEAQKKQFSSVLATYPTIASVLEIGLNAGHSADYILKTCPSIKKFFSIDISVFRYTILALIYLSKKYEKVFQFIQGDSQKILPDYSSLRPSEKFDLIYIDGNHSYEGCSKDIESCKKLSHPGTRLWIDDYHLLGPSQAILGAQIEGLIEVIAFHESSDPFGPRYWVEAKYLCKKTSRIL